jgi:hypothetical protein
MQNQISLPKPRLKYNKTMEYLIFKTVVITIAAIIFIWQAIEVRNSMFQNTNYLDVLNLRRLSSHIFNRRSGYQEATQGLENQRQELLNSVKPRLYVDRFGAILHIFSREDVAKTNQARNLSNQKMLLENSYKEEIAPIVDEYNFIANKKFGVFSVKNILDEEIREEQENR